ncbi:hypothetical protein RV04_GL001915 [Enterococcus hermanniensis]|uniref:Hyaluronan synthase n=1 Tax=Enterococcus hermanniensis TaxID=249189 RepID=A0A1L8TMT7_9ENTE|nr:hypothetical protein RV04_GL001915 [Enterococcus hermanniensis]
MYEENYPRFLILPWGIYGLVLLVCFFSYTFRWLPKQTKIDTLKEARVIAIIPAYNEDPELLKNTIRSIQEQTFKVQEIHVVDDGSVPEVKPYEAKDVVWHRQENKGKRHAQGCAINHIEEQTVDFILTVDSDSVLAKNAVEKLIMAFEADKEVMGATGFVVTRNYNTNWITRISDINIGVSCFVTRASRSITGSLETTSGALSMYRKEILFDNLPHYLNSGTYSDDRQLCMYSEIAGKAIGVQEALVFSDMPTTFKGLWNQRKRWGKGGWKYFPFQVTNLSVVDLFFPFLGMVQWTTVPAFYLIVAVALSQGHYNFIYFYIVLKLSTRYLEAAIYLLGSPHMKSGEKFLSWLFITPFDFFLTTFVLVFAKFSALFALREDHWLTR